MPSRNSFTTAALSILVASVLACGSQPSSTDGTLRPTTSTAAPADMCFRIDFFRNVRLLDIDSQNRLVVDQASLGDPALTLTAGMMYVSEGPDLTVSNASALAVLADLALEEPPFSVFVRFSYDGVSVWAQYFPPPVATATMQPELHFDGEGLPLRLIARAPVDGLDFETDVLRGWTEALATGECP